MKKIKFVLLCLSLSTLSFAGSDRIAKMSDLKVMGSQLSGRIDSGEKKTDSNTQAILVNKGDVGKNTADISRNLHYIETNTKQIGVLEEVVKDHRTILDSHGKQISLLEAGVKENSKGIAKNASSIQLVADHLSVFKKASDARFVSLNNLEKLRTSQTDLALESLRHQMEVIVKTLTANGTPPVDADYQVLHDFQAKKLEGFLSDGRYSHNFDFANMTLVQLEKVNEFVSICLGQDKLKISVKKIVAVQDDKTPGFALSESNGEIQLSVNYSEIWANAISDGVSCYQN